MTTSRLTNQFLCSTAIDIVQRFGAPDGAGGSYKAKPKTNPNFTTLEPRVLFDAAMADSLETVVDGNHDVVSDQNDADHDLLLAALGADLPAPVDATVSQQVPIVFIDGAVDDIDVLIADIGPNAEIHILDSNADGVEQIAAVLAGRTDIASLHIISHGRSGTLDLGDTKLTAASMAGEYADEMAVIAASLGSNADILIYGCDFAAGSRGREAVALLAALTGADVAASDDLTGAADLGGDWDLEDQVGLVETGLLRLESWSGTLSLVNTGNWTVSGTTATNTTSGVTSTITFAPTAGGTAVLNATPQVFNTTPGFFANGADGDASLGFVYTWDTTPEGATGVPQPDASNDDAPMTVTITFSTPVTNPIINIDRLGGNGTFDPNTSTVGGEDSRSNSSMWTLTTPGATLLELAGVGHFDVTSTTFQRTPNQVMALAGISGEASTNALTSTAAGSIQVTGTFTTLTFVVSGVGVEGAGADGIEIGLALDAPPTAQDDGFTMNEDTTLTGSLFANNGSGADADPTADALTVTQVNGASFTVGTPIALANGSLTITNAATGAFTFLPNANYTGGQAFTYTIADPAGGTDTATASITVNPVNDAPFDGNEANTVTEDTTLNVLDGAAGDLLLNASDVEGSPLTITSFTIAGVAGTQVVGAPVLISGVGTITINANGSYSFAPTSNYTGAIPVMTYTVSDGALTDTSTLSLSMLAVNDPPVLDNDGNNSSGQTGFNYETTYTENAPSVPVVDSDVTITDIDSTNIDTATITLTNAFPLDTLQVGAMPLGIAAMIDTSVPGVITVTLIGPGSLADFQTAIQSVRFLTTSENPNPTDRIVTVSVNDGFATSNVATSIINVIPVNDNPTLDLDGNNSSGVNGGNYTTAYTENAAPTPIGDIDTTIFDLDDTNIESATITLTNGRLGDLLTIGTLPAGVTLVGVPPTNLMANGTITIQLAGSASLADYQAAIEAIGFSSNSEDIDATTRTVTVVVSDGNINSNTATASIVITPVNDAPVAADNAQTINEDTIATGNVITDLAGADTDVEGDLLTVTSFDIDTDGDATSETFNAGDTATITGVGTLVINTDGSYSFTPVLNYNGPVPVATYTMTDGALSDTATLSITITPVNDAPVAVDNGPIPVTEDTPVSGNVITDVPGADTDVDLDALTVTTFVVAGDPTVYVAGSTATIPGVGTLVIGATGAYSFTPALNYNGPVPVATYTITDGALTDTAVLSFADITDVNDAPVANDDGPVAVTEDTPVSGNVITDAPGADTDVDLDALTVTTFVVAGDPTVHAAGSTASIPGVGTLVIGATGAFSFTPDLNYNGPVPVATYTITDGALTDTATLSFADITDVNDAPVANDDGPVAVTEDTPVSGNVLPNDSDVDGDPLSVVSFTVAGDPTVYSAGTTATIPGVGTLLIGPTGAFTFTPALNYNGPVPVATYTITDGALTDTATLSFSDITDVNDAPVANDDGPVAVTEDTPVSGNVITDAPGADTDVDLDALTVTTFVVAGDPTVYSAGTTATIPGVGTLVIGATGAYSFTPDLNYNGPVPVATYTITDGTAADDAVLSFADIINVNDAPVAANDTSTVNEDTPATGNVITDNPGTDTDMDGDTLSVSGFTVDTNGDGADETFNPGGTATIPGVGTLQINSDGTYSFTPEANYDGPVPIATYTVTDGVLSNTATLAIDITPVNDPPVGPPNGELPAETTTDGATLSIALPAGSFTDPDGDTLIYSLAPGAPVWLSIDPATGEITGTVPADASVGGPYTLTVVATDPSGETASADLPLNITNPAPVAVDDDSSNGEDTPQSGDVLANDADAAPDSDPLTVSEVNGLPGLVGLPLLLTYGDVTINPDGSWTFSPNAAANALATGATVTETIAYKVSDGNGGFDDAVLTIEIVGLNDAPEEQGPVADQFDNDGETITPLDVGAVFSDPDGDPLTFTATDLPPGLVIDPATGIISGTLEPDASQGGPYALTVTSTDPDGNTASTTFDWAVANPAPVAEDNSASTQEDMPVIIGVLGNDSDVDGDALTVVGASDPANGSVAVNPDGSIMYTPEPGFNGTDTFTYTISDGNGGLATATVTVSVGVVNDVPVGTPITQQANDDATSPTLDVSGNFSDPDGQPLTFTATGLPPGLSIDPTTGIVSGTIDPDASQGGPYNVVVTATDTDGGTASVPFEWVVNNPSPVAQDNTIGTNPDTPVTIDVLVDDIDPDGDPLSVDSVTQPANGSVVINPDGTVTYTPDAGFQGTDTFTYTLSDGNGGTDTATVSVQVPPGPQIPDATPIDPQSDDDGETITLDVSDNFTDPNGDPLTFSASGLPPGLMVDPNTGVISGTIDPDASQGGPYTVTITAVDPDGNAVSTTFPWNVANPVPVAEANTTATPEETPVTIAVLGNDVDPDGDPITVTSTTPPANGTVSINPDGTITYTPDAGFQGTDTFTYTIGDNNGGSSTATVTINVGPVNDSPLASTIPTQCANDGEAITPLDASGAFADPDGDDLDFTAEGLPPGLVIDPETGVITGTLEPGASQNGPYTVSITATDLSGASSTTSFVWNVANLPPVAVDDAASTNEDTSSTGNVLTGAGNTVPGSGVDHDTAPDSDPLTITAADQAGVPLTIGVPFTTTGGGILTLQADGSYSFNPGRAYNGLALGETATETISYAIADGNGGTDTAQLIIAIEGTNDGPVVVDPDLPVNPTDPEPAPDPFDVIPDVATTDGGTPPVINVAQYFVDPDGEKLIFVVTGLPPGLLFNPTTGLIEGTLTPNASQGGPDNNGVYLVTVTATDPNGLMAMSTLVYTVGNLSPVAIDDVSAGNEDNPQSGNVLTDPVSGDADTAPDSDPLTVSAVAGGTVGAPIVLTYGTFVMQPNGAWVFTPNATANALPVGAPVTETLTYTVSDGNGGTDTAVLTIGIIGVNDAPTGTPLPGQSDFEGDEVEIDISTAFSDPDGDTLTFTATGLPPGLVLDPVTGLIIGAPAPGSANNGPYPVTITANDGHGGTVTLSFIWVVQDQPVSGPEVPVVPLPVPPWQTGGGETIQHVITDTVNGLKPLGGTPTLTDHVITRTVQSLSDLNSAIDLDDGHGVITRLVEWAGRQGREAAWLQGLFDQLDHAPYGGDSMDLALSLDAGDLLRVKSVVVDGAMFIGFDRLAPDVQIQRVSSNGTGLPDFVAIIDPQNLVVNVRAGQQWLDLTIWARDG